MDEEVVLLEEQLATAHVDVERLQSQLADLTARQSQQETEVQELLDQLEASRAETEAVQSRATAHAEEMQRISESMAAAEARGREAVQRYREVVLEREPQLPADLVTGESIGEAGRGGGAGTADGGAGAAAPRPAVAGVAHPGGCAGAGQPGRF